MMMMVVIIYERLRFYYFFYVCILPPLPLPFFDLILLHSNLIRKLKGVRLLINLYLQQTKQSYPLCSARHHFLPQNPIRNDQSPTNTI
jgi:hypothetical protein